MDWTKAANRLSTELPSWVMGMMSDLATVWPESYLGGGAVRDILLGQPVKDWDFYFPLHYSKDGNTDSLINTLKKVLSPFPDWKIWKDIDSITEPLYDTNFIVLRGQRHGDFCDFIFSGQSIDDFDHAICQCKINCKDYSLETTKWFDQCVSDKIHRVFTKNLYNAAATHKSIHSHTTRIQRKYPWPIFLETGIAYHYVEH